MQVILIVIFVFIVFYQFIMFVGLVLYLQNYLYYIVFCLQNSRWVLQFQIRGVLISCMFRVFNCMCFKLKQVYICFNKNFCMFLDLLRFWFIIWVVMEQELVGYDYGQIVYGVVRCVVMMLKYVSLFYVILGLFVCSEFVELSRLLFKFVCLDFGICIFGLIFLFVLELLVVLV